MNLDSLVNFFASIPTDGLIIGVFAIGAAFDCLRSGARRVCMLALALPVSALLMDALSRAAFLESVAGQLSNPLLEGLLFLALLVIVYVLIGRMWFAWGEETGQTLYAALGGVAATALVVTFWLSIPALDAIWHFGPQAQAIFGESYRFWWILGSYAALAFVRNS